MTDELRSIEIPDLATVKAFMLKRGDMYWNSNHQWFYECQTDGYTSYLGVADADIQIARSPVSAQNYNAERRKQALS